MESKINLLLAKHADSEESRVQLEKAKIRAKELKSMAFWTVEEQKQMKSLEKELKAKVESLEASVKQEREHTSSLEQKLEIQETDRKNTLKSYSSEQALHQQTTTQTSQQAVEITDLKMRISLLSEQVTEVEQSLEEPLKFTVDDESDEKS